MENFDEDTATAAVVRRLIEHPARTLGVRITVESCKRSARAVRVEFGAPEFRPGVVYGREIVIAGCRRAGEWTAALLAAIEYAAKKVAESTSSRVA